MRIRKFEEKDTIDVASLISRTYTKFNSSDYFEKKAAQDYMDFFNPNKTSEKEILMVFSKATIFYIAEEDSKIIGAIRGTPGRLSSLFIEGTHQKKGVGTELLLRFEREAIHQGAKEIRLRSQLYAVSFYEKMGYKKTRGLINAKGLKVYPMKKIF